MGCVVSYSVFLGTFNEVKKVILQKATAILKLLKGKFKSKKNTTEVIDEIKVSKQNENANLFENVDSRKSNLVEALLLHQDSTRGKHAASETQKLIWKSLQTLDCNNKPKAQLLELNQNRKTVSVESKIKRLVNDTKMTCKNSEQLQDESEKTESNSDSDSGMKYVQILLYYVQDATLFKVHLPNVEEESNNFLVKLLQFSPEILTVYYKVSDLCFTRNTTAVVKVFMSSMFGPCIIVFLFIVYLVQWMISSYFKRTSNFWETLRSKLTQAFLLTVLFSYQKIIKGAFSLIQCVKVNEINVLYIQGDIKCYTWWQFSIEFYLYLSVVPVFITLAVCPFFVKNNQMSVIMLVLACLLPVPVLLYLVVAYILRIGNSYKRSKSSKVNERGNNVSSAEYVLDHIRHTMIHIPVSYGKNKADEIPNDKGVDDNRRNSLKYRKSRCMVSDDMIFQEVNDDLKITVKGTKHEAIHDNKNKMTRNSIKENGRKYTKSEETVSYILLKHYKPLNLLGISMTWLGVHKLYRMSLVGCYTYIKEPLPRLSAMTSLVICMGMATMGVKPYKDSKANKTANLSYVASLCIAIINVSRSSLVTANYKVSSATVATTLHYFNLCENVLLTWLPLVAIVIWVLFSIWQRITQEKGKGSELKIHIKQLKSIWKKN